MAEKRGRGRPIKWEEAFKKYQTTARYYTKRANTGIFEQIFAKFLVCIKICAAHIDILSKIGLQNGKYAVK